MVMTPSSTCAGTTGSTDPLLQIPHELSAVLTLKRGAQIRTSSLSSSPSPARDLGGSTKGRASKTNTIPGEEITSSPLLQTPLSLKKKRESIV